MPWGEFLGGIAQVSILFVFTVSLTALAVGILQGLRDAFRGKTHDDDDDETMERLADDDPRRDGAL